MSLNLRLYTVLAMGAIGFAPGCADSGRSIMAPHQRASLPVQSTSIGDAGQTPSFENTSNDAEQGDLPNLPDSAAGAADESAAEGSVLADGSAFRGTAEACRLGAQRCSEPLTIGEADTELNWIPWTVPNDQAYFVPIELPVNGVLSSFVLRAAGDHGSCTMAIYDDAAGRPSKLLAETFGRAPVEPGRQSAAPNGEITLKEGRYWIGGACFLWPTGAQLYSRPSDGAAYFRFAHTETTYPNDPVGELLTGETYSFGITVGRLP